MPASHMGVLPSLPPKIFGNPSLPSSATSQSLSGAGAKKDPTITSPKRKAPTPLVSAARGPSLAGPPTARAKPNSVPFDTSRLRNDRLGTLVRELCANFYEAPSWETFVSTFRGPSYLAEALNDVAHPAAALLREWRDEGVPVHTSSLPWTDKQKDDCINRGCHPSATLHADFLREEMADSIESKFWMVLPYELVKHLEELMIWPAAVKDEHNRRPRLLCDHSWDWGWPSVNDTTIPHAPPEAMQFGGALDRLVFFLRHANRIFGPPRIAKQDVKDGFYRLYLLALACLRLAIVLPKYDGEPQLLAIPMACTMGWVQSPPTFCTMSETICDLANQDFARLGKNVSPHRLEEAASAQDDLSPSMEPRPIHDEEAEANQSLAIPGSALKTRREVEERVPPSNCPSTKPLAYTDVFMDDYIQLGQGGPDRMNAIRRHLLHAADKVLAMPSASQEKRHEALSIKKMLQGDGSWTTRKLLLGWVVDSLRQTLELSARRKLELAKIFASLCNAKRVSRKRWERLLGKIRWLAVAIPGSQGLLGALQLALNRCTSNRIRINQELKDHIYELARLSSSLRERPTYLAEIVPQEPTLLGATDAAKVGMGGIFYDSKGSAYLWRHPFSPELQSRLVTEENPTGIDTNSDLEHAGLLAQVSLMADHHNVRYATLLNCCDNTPAVSRVTKGSVVSEGPSAYLCHFACQHQRTHRYCHVSQYLPGDANVMADDASRLQHLTDSAFLAHFEQHYPQPKGWVLLQLRPEVASTLTSMLLSNSPLRPTQEGIERRKALTSGDGCPSANPSESPLPSVILPTLRQGWATYWSTDSGIEKKEQPTNLYELTRWTKPSWPWLRGSPTWVSQIPENKDPEETYIPYSLLSSKPSETQTILPAEPTQPTSPSCENSTTSSTDTMPSTDLSTTTSSTSSLSLSSGSSARQNTLTPATPTRAPKPSATETSTSPSLAESTTRPLHL